MAEPDVDARPPSLIAGIRGLLDTALDHNGGRLPSERQLSETFATTRITLREALVHLEAEGAIYREDRRGWFVSPPRLLYNPLRRGHFDRMVQEQGRVPRTEVLGSGLSEAPSAVASVLGLGGRRAIHVRRVRFIDDRRVLYAEHFVHPDRFPGLMEHDLTISMTEIYARHYGTVIGQVTFDILPTALAGYAAGPLRVASGSPSLLITRTNLDQYGHVVDCDVEYWRHDAILVRVEALDE